MSDCADYLVRLKVGIGKGLTTDETMPSTEFNGRIITVKSAEKDQL